MGEIRKLVLISNVFGYGPEPPIGEELEQRVTLRINGKASVTRYAYAGRGNLKRIQMKRPYCAPEEAQRLFAELQEALKRGLKPAVMDAPVWRLLLEFDDGSRIEAYGSPIKGYNDLDGISRALRRILDAPYLFAFDGEPDYS